MERYQRPVSSPIPSTTNNSVDTPSTWATNQTRHQRDDSESTLQGQEQFINFSRKRKIVQRQLPVIVAGETILNRLSAHLNFQDDGQHPAQDGRRSWLSPSLRPIWLPLSVVLIPNVACPVVLLVLIFTNRFRPDVDLFGEGRERSQEFPGYILVTLSATRLAIIPSITATLAPFLTVFIMAVWKLHVIGKAPQVPNTEIARVAQLGLLIGLLEASFGGLITYLRGWCPRCIRGRHAPARMNRGNHVHSSALVFLLCICLVLSMFVGDTVIHTQIDAVNVVQSSVKPETSLFGHRLSDECQNFPRKKNDCLPCTWNITSTVPVFQQRSNYINEIMNDISQTTQIHIVDDELSILLPYSARVSNITEYKTTTIGIVNKCRPITNSCQPKVIAINDSYRYTQFNCSEAFRGIIYKSPVQPTNQNFTTADPDTPPLVQKPSAYLEFGIFEDEDLSIPYNPVNYNVSEPGWALLYGDSSTTECPSDVSLLTEIHVGVAGRFNLMSTRVELDFLNDAGLFNRGNNSYYLDFVFGCSIQAVEVEYVWADQRIRSYTTKPVNGSVLNMYVGQMTYYSASPDGSWTNDIIHMALNNNSNAMADTFATLFSRRMLSVIGGYTTTSANSEEQTRGSVLIAKIPIGVLAFLLSCNFIYAVLILTVAIHGCIIAYRNPDAYRRIEDLSFAGQLSKSAETELANLTNGGIPDGNDDNTAFHNGSTRTQTHDEPDLLEHPTAQIVDR